MGAFPHNVLILADPREMAGAKPVWGSGGWLPPEERRGLDWFTLCRLSGLRPFAAACDSFDPATIDDAVHWLILACDPAVISNDLIHMLEEVLKQKTVTIICEAPGETSLFADWLGIHSTREKLIGSLVTVPGWPDPCEWTCRKPVEIRRVKTDRRATVMAWLDEFPMIASTPSGMGRVIATGFDASGMRDADGVFTRLLQRLIVYSSPVPLPWTDWSHTLVLRMDDPGSCEALYNVRYHNSKLRAEEWRSLGRELVKRDARLSVCYVTGWVDAGDSVKGTLEIHGKKVGRISGKVYPSPAVRFESPGDEGILIYDHVEEFRAIRALMDAGLVGVEMHGYTHLTPDRQSWLKADDRFDENSWFREFGKNASRYLDDHPEIPHPIEEAMDVFETFFDCRPTSLICPGEEFTHHVLGKALSEGLPLVSSYYIAIRDDGRFCWSQHVCAPYLDIPGESWFDAALPVVGYFHDFDIAERGVGWFSGCLDQWQQAGARKIIDLGELAAVLGMRFEMRKTDAGWELEVETGIDLPSPRPFELKIHFPDGDEPSAISCIQDGQRRVLPACHAKPGCASVTIGG